MNWCFSTKLRFKCVCDNPKRVDVFACGSSIYIDRHKTFVIGHAVTGGKKAKAKAP